jgi:hypothetical protein
LAVLATPALAQEPAPAWSYPQFRPAPAAVLPPPPVTEYAVEPDGPIPSGLPDRSRLRDREKEPGQQHWVSMSLGVFQPFAARIGVKVWPRPQNSVWLEAYAGSVLFEVMYGFGVRVQRTAWESGNKRLMVAPGFGVHVVPSWLVESRTYYTDPVYGYSYYDYSSHRNALYWVFGDVDVSWLYDFDPHFGFEFGVKLGLAGLVGGKVGRRYPEFVMFGKSVYPIFSIYSGFRF